MVNNVVLVGRITRDLELKATANGRELINFSVAVNRNFKNAQGTYDADFINCVAFGQTAKFMSTYLGKGRLISVVGRISTRSYDNNQGQRVYVTEIIADNVSGLDSARNNDNGGYNNQAAPSYDNAVMNQGPQSFMDTPQTAPDNSPFSINTIGGDINDDDLPF